MSKTYFQAILKIETGDKMDKIINLAMASLLNPKDRADIVFIVKRVYKKHAQKLGISSDELEAVLRPILEQFIKDIFSDEKLKE